MNVERVFYVAKGNDPYDHFMYVCGPNERGLYASCHVYPVDGGQHLQEGVMRMVREDAFAGKIETDIHESSRVMTYLHKSLSAHGKGGRR